MMASRDGASGLLIGAVIGTLFLVPAHGSAQDSLAVSCVAVDPADPFADPNFTFEFLRSCAERVQLTRMVDVDGHYMPALTIGLENAESGSPVVVFEAGAGGGLATWGSVVGDVANFAPVVAYSRAGLPGSEWDGQLPTPRHVAENLHALLEQVGAEPPYVLVGHSLGGPHIRMFTGMYPEDVAGLVYVDPTDIVTEHEARARHEAMGLSAEDAQRRRETGRQDYMANFPAIFAPGLRAEAEVIFELFDTYFAEFHSLPPMPDIPVTVLMATQFNPAQWASLSSNAQLDCEPRECHARTIALRMEMLSNFAHQVTMGMLTLAPTSGHFIQIDEPDLVIQAIREVVDATAR